MSQIKALSVGPRHHFFGYYDIAPWDRSFRHHLALETSFHDHRPRVGEYASVGLIEAQTGAFVPHGRTSAFNFQQGSMMHWIEAGFGEEFTFNDWLDGRLAARAVSVETGHVRTIQGAIAAVSPAEPIAIGLNYARMAACRPVAGYASAGYRTDELEPRPEDGGLYLLGIA